MQKERTADAIWIVAKAYAVLVVLIGSALGWLSVWRIVRGPVREGFATMLSAWVLIVSAMMLLIAADLLASWIRDERRDR